MIKKTTLQNGLRVVTVPQPSTRTVTVLALVHAGSKNETKEINGISHFLEHMFFKGTKKMPTPLAVAEALDEIGGDYNAFTTEDCTGYYAKVDAAHFDVALEWVADIFLHSKLPKKEVEKEKGVVIEEIHMYEDNPARHVGDLWMKHLYGDQPAGWNVAGTKETVLALSQKDLQQYMSQQYVASNTVVCVAGNVPQRKAVEKVRKAFSAIKEESPVQKQEVEETQVKPEMLLEWRKVNQTNIALGVRGYSLQDPRRFTQELLAIVLGGMMSSRLFVEVREKLGLAYSVSTHSESNPDTGFLLTTAGVKNDSAEKAISVILKEHAKLKRQLIPADELRKAKEYMKGKMALDLESSSAKANFYGMQELLHDQMLTPEQLYDTIKKIKPEDMREIAKELFRPEKLNLVVLGPYRDEQPFLSLLKI